MVRRQERHERLRRVNGNINGGGMSPVGFDLDMTLINSRPAILASFDRTARDTSTAIDLEAVDRRLGIKLDDELAFWFPADQVDAAAGVYRGPSLGLIGGPPTG